MRKLMLAAVAMLALGGAGLAVAKSGGGSVTAVTGTFTATTVSHSEQTTCTTSDGKTLQLTNATYTGTAAGDASLAGPVTVQARSTIDTTANLGIVRGKVRFGSSDGSQAQFTAVYDHGNIAGLAVGHAGTPHTALVGNLSAAFSATGGLTGGKIGGAAGGSAVLLGPGTCSSSHSQGSGGDGKDKGTHQGTKPGKQ
jgi:hypothetical protein